MPSVDVRKTAKWDSLFDTYSSPWAKKQKNGRLVPVEVANAIIYFIKAYHFKAQSKYDSKVAMATVGCQKEMPCTVSSADCIALQFSIRFSS